MLYWYSITYFYIFHIYIALHFLIIYKTIQMLNIYFPLPFPTPVHVIGLKTDIS